MTFLQHEIDFLKHMRNTHDEKDCKSFACCIHSPSDHHMRKFPMNWRNDRKMMERICECGIGHPDPDHLAFVARTFGESNAVTEGVHGCCGHCEPGEFERMNERHT